MFASHKCLILFDIVKFCYPFIPTNCKLFIPFSRNKDRNMPGICPRCEKPVYFAEEVKALGNVYHKLCFSCTQCRKLLDPGSITEHDGELYCNNCYK